MRKAPSLYVSTPDAKPVLCIGLLLFIVLAVDLKNKFSEILSLNYITYEIMLIEEIRTKQGLLNLKIDHPLLETKLANVPKSLVDWDLSKDEIYQFLLKRE